MGTAQRDVSRKRKGGWGRGEKVSLPLFLLIFFSLSSFAPHSAIRTGTDGTRTIDQNHGSFKYQAASIYTRKK